MFAVLDIDECRASSVCDINAKGLSKCPSIIFSSINMFVVLDIDECGASSPVCDINANCSNTRGSYICTCNSGYTGDGKMCQGRIKVDLPCDNNEEGRFPGTCNDQQKSVILVMQSIYVQYRRSCLGLYFCY